ncbi:MAG: class I SAM-dependent methyltransferase [Draconibacterium sp.]
MQNVKFTQANALNLDFSNESFDTIFMANLIHYRKLNTNFTEKKIGDGRQKQVR